MVWTQTRDGEFSCVKLQAAADFYTFNEGTSDFGNSIPVDSDEGLAIATVAQ